MVEFVKELKKEFDFVFMDCPAGIEQGFENAVAAADEALVICTPEVSAVRDADRVIGLLYSKSITPKLIVNRIVPEMVERGDMLSHTDVLDVLSIDLLGLIPMDENVVVATNTGTPIIFNNQSKAGNAFKRIGLRLDGHPDLPIEVPSTKSSLWKKIVQKFAVKK